MRVRAPLSRHKRAPSVLAASRTSSLYCSTAKSDDLWAEAQRLGKADVVGPMLADNFVNTDVDGATYGKAQLLSNLKGGKWEENGISDVKVNVYGDAAVATGSWR